MKDINDNQYVHSIDKFNSLDAILPDNQNSQLSSIPMKFYLFF